MDANIDSKIDGLDKNIETKVENLRQEFISQRQGQVAIFVTVLVSLAGVVATLATVLYK